MRHVRTIEEQQVEQRKFVCLDRQTRAGNRGDHDRQWELKDSRETRYLYCPPKESKLGRHQHRSVGIPGGIIHDLRSTGSQPEIRQAGTSGDLTQPNHQGTGWHGDRYYSRAMAHLSRTRFMINSIPIPKQRTRMAKCYSPQAACIAGAKIRATVTRSQNSAGNPQAGSSRALPASALSLPTPPKCVNDIRRGGDPSS